MHDDRELIERIRLGDPDAFRIFVQQYQRLVYQFTRNIVRKIQDAEDLTQDVFLAAFRHLETFDITRSKPSTWLLTIARNRCLSHLSRNRLSTPGDVESADHRPCPEQEVTRREVWQQLDIALESLPIEQRTAFVLAEIQELPYAEIAAIEDVELGTVKSRVSRAKERLRQVMKEWRPESTSSAAKPPGVHHGRD